MSLREKGKVTIASPGFMRFASASSRRASFSLGRSRASNHVAQIFDVLVRLGENETLQAPAIIDGEGRLEVRNEAQHEVLRGIELTLVPGARGEMEKLTRNHELRDRSPPVFEGGPYCERPPRDDTNIPRAERVAGRSLARRERSDRIPKP